MLRERFLAVIHSVWFLVLAALALSACGSGLNPTTTAVALETRLVPAGWFLMGENDGRESNQPQRHVYLDAFEIQLTEVTRTQFVRFLSDTGSIAPGFQELDQDEWEQNKANTAESGIGDVLPVGSFPESASPYGL